MSYIKIYIHAVWTTKDRNPYLTDKNKLLVLEHIKENAKLKKHFNKNMMNLSGITSFSKGLKPYLESTKFFPRPKGRGYFN